MADISDGIASPEARPTAPPHVVAAWPKAHEWPTATDPSIVHARFARDRLGWIPRPTSGPFDRWTYARKLEREAFDDIKEMYRREPTDEERTAIWDDARDIADKAARGPIGYIRCPTSPADVDDAYLERCWGGKHGHERGICIMPGRSTRGLPVVLVDVDVGHGDSPAGDLDGPWGAGLPGPKSRTPRGGLHTLVLSIGGERSSGGATGLAQGVDVIGCGGTPINIPAGSATPDRQWICWDPPVVAPEALRKAPVWCGQAGDRGGHTGSSDGQSGPASTWTGPGASEGGSGRAAECLRSMHPKGARGRACGTIVGMLARRGACPPDVVAACLEVLVEDMAARDKDETTTRAEMDRWTRLLTQGPRDRDFACEVIMAWSTVRDGEGGRRRWSFREARMQARSHWDTAARRQEGFVGTEDHAFAAEGVGEPEVEAAAAVSRSMADAWARGPEREPEQVGAGSSTVVLRAALAPDPAPAAFTPPQPGPQPPPPSVDVIATAPAKDIGAKITEQTLRSLLPTLGQAYTREDRHRDYARRPLSVDVLYPFADFVTGDLEREAGSGHGMGRGFSRALGGIAAGSAKVVGAPSGKAGKSHFLGQMLEGVALCTAARIIGDVSYANAPIILPVWVSEMPKKGEAWLRMLSRHCGFDLAAIAEGELAEEANGVTHMANALQWTSYEVVRRARSLADFYDDHPDDTALGFALKYLVRQIRLSVLPRAKGAGSFREDPRAGPALMDRVADAVAIYRRDLAAQLGVSEDKVLPVVMLDPCQRFAGESHSQKAAIDALLLAAHSRICGSEMGLEGALLATSDTTKSATKETPIEVFLSEDGKRLAADVFAGSAAIVHVFDGAVAVSSREPPPGALKTTQYARVLLGRTGAPAECYPFEWEMHTGRFRARPAEPLRAPVDADDKSSPRDRFRNRGTGSPPGVGTEPASRSRPYGTSSRYGADRTDD